MGAGPSTISISERRSNLYKYDNEIKNLSEKRSKMTINRDILQNKLNDLNNELDDLNNQIKLLNTNVGAKTTEKKGLEDRIQILNEDKKTAEHLLNVTNRAIYQILQYGNLQERTQQYLDDEYIKLYNKVILRQKLKFKDYSNRNDSLSITTDKVVSDFSNSFRNAEYQDQHNKYFMSLNAIFWWVYYILFIILTYQVVYIKTDMNIKSKILLLGGLLIYPLLYRFYDLIIMKI